ncbi:MAG: FAD:protein FMN transferase [Candidatus Omnitrophota bacterium]|nr:MAG: FAD:protein FMN transferase [Candidatus Omnitrophota bacterium]
MIKKIILSIFCIALCSCSQPLYKDTFIISGTYLEVVSSHKEAAKIVHEEFKRLDKIFNMYDPESEVSRLNTSYDEPLEVSPELIEVLQIAQRVYHLSGGAFDISHGSLYIFWKELIKKGKVEKFPSHQEISQLKELGGMNHLAVRPHDQTVTIKRKGLKVDLSGIAKGYIVDRAVLQLKKSGIDSALINAGGDIYCLGKISYFGSSKRSGPKHWYRKRPWRIGIQDPGSGEDIIHAQELIDEAIATSGNYEQFFEFADKRYSHILDPRTGYPVANNIVSVSVISRNCTAADSLATAFFIMGLEEIQNFFSANPSMIKIFVVAHDGNSERMYVFQ